MTSICIQISMHIFRLQHSTFQFTLIKKVFERGTWISFISPAQNKNKHRLMKQGHTIHFNLSVHSIKKVFERGTWISFISPAHLCGWVYFVLKKQGHSIVLRADYNYTDGRSHGWVTVLRRLCYSSFFLLFFSSLVQRLISYLVGCVSWNPTLPPTQALAT